MLLTSCKPDQPNPTIAWVGSSPSCKTLGCTHQWYTGSFFSWIEGRSLWFWLQEIGNKEYIKAHLYTRVKANAQLKSSIPIVAKVEINPQDFTLGIIKAEIEKIFSIHHKLLMYAELYGIVLAPRL